MKFSIKVMADYNCWPLWQYGSGEVGNIDPATLPLSANLKNELAVWASQFDANLNNDDPAASDWPSAGVQQIFVEKGRALAKRLWVELGNEAEVVYFNDVTRSIEAL